MEEVKVPEGRPVRLLQWLVKKGDWVKYGLPLLIYRRIEDPSTGAKTKEQQLRSKHVGRVKNLALDVGKVATAGCTLVELESCSHPVVIKDMCAECGQDLRLLEDEQGEKNARVSMVHNIPELKISNQQAEELGEQDKERLHKMRKLVLLVDLDQTLIHTSQNQAFASMCKNNEDFYVFQLQRNEPTLYTKIRPYCRKFLEHVSQKFELQIVTFGSRQYAHKIAEFIDPKKKFFAHRILSRDECMNPMRKSGNLRHLFPCGDSMVCIIDDREDVWSGIPNVVLVKKYAYFPGAGDINSPDKLEAKKKLADTSKNETNATTQPARKRKSNEQTDEAEHSCKIKKTSVETSTNETVDSETPLEDTIAPDSQPSSTTNGSNQSSSSPPDLSPVDSSSTPHEGPDSSTDADKSSQKEEEIDVDLLDLFSPADSEASSAPSKDPSNNNDETEISEKNLDGGLMEASDHRTHNHNHVNKTDNAPLSEESKSTENDKDRESNQIDPDSTTGDSDETSNQKMIVEKPSEVVDTDDYLKYLQVVLTEIHSTYYEAYDKHVAGDYEHLPDIRGIVPFIRSKVLYGCYIVLTGIIPNNFKGTPHQHKAYIVAKQLGATIDNNVSERTTHLIGGKKGTTKYQDALKRGGIKFVSADWLWACSERWDKVSELLYPIPSKRDANSQCRSRENTPPITKAVKWEASVARTYDPITGKLVKNVPDPRLPLLVEVRQQKQKLQHPLYSSLQDPEVVVPIEPELPCEPTTSKAAGRATRSRKPSMAEMMGIEYSLSSNDISEMDKEVDDLLSSDEESTENTLGTIVEKVATSSSENSTPIPASEEKSDGGDSSSSSEEEFDHMAELLDHEMHYDEDNGPLDSLD